MTRPTAHRMQAFSGACAIAIAAAAGHAQITFRGAGFPGNCVSSSPHAISADGSTSAPVLNVIDFMCFQQRFAAGCQ